MGKKYYGGIGTDKGFVMHSPENEHRYDRGGGNNDNDDDSAGGTRIEVSDEDLDSTQSNFDVPCDEDCSNADSSDDAVCAKRGRANANNTCTKNSEASANATRESEGCTADDNSFGTCPSNASRHRTNCNGRPGSTRDAAQGANCDTAHDNDRATGRTADNPRTPYDNNRDDCDDELDDFFEGLFSIKAYIALAIESLFKALMSRSMKRIDFVAVTLMLLVCTRVIGAVFIDSSSLNELNAFAFVVTLSVLGVCTISEKCPANALTALVIACLPALIEIVTACAVNGSDADAFSRITNWALVGCLGSAALLIVGTLIDPFGDEEEDESENTSMDGGEVTSIGMGTNVGTGMSMNESTTANEDAACERVFFIPFWGAAIGATAALIWELAPYIAREIVYGTAPLCLSYMGCIV